MPKERHHWAINGIKHTTLSQSEGKVTSIVTDSLTWVRRTPDSSVDPAHQLKFNQNAFFQICHQNQRLSTTMITIRCDILSLS